MYGIVHAIDPCATQNEFSVNPSTQIVPENEPSWFKCQHPMANFIGWRINGTSLSSYSTTDVSSHIDGPMHTLSIIARSVYNESTVECIALLPGGQPPQISAAAQLVVQGLFNFVSVHES